MKLVSICIPAYKAAHLRECLTSAIAQTYKSCEIIVSDDCPGDEVERICAGFTDYVKYVRNPNPGRLGRNNLNNLYQLSNGEYIKFLFDDDILNPFCVQYLVEALEETVSKGTSLAFSPRQIIDIENREVKLVNLFEVTVKTVIPGNAIITRMASDLVNPIGEYTTVLFRKRDSLDASGNPRMGEVEGEVWQGLGDVATWTSLALKGDFVIHPATLSYFRSHKDLNSNPKINPEWIYAVTDWKKVVEWSYRQGLLRDRQLFLGYKNLIRLLRNFPELSSELHEVENTISELPMTLWDRFRLKREFLRIRRRQHAPQPSF